MLKAVQIEMYYSKKEILEAYLNLAPCGGNIEGFGTASLVYYNKQVSELTLVEAITLSVIPQSPEERTPSNNNDKLIGARNKLFVDWINKNYPE